MLSSDEIKDFLSFLANIRKYSNSTVSTYEQVLLEAADKIEVYSEKDKTVYDIMCYRISISKLAKKTIAKKISVLRSFFEYKRSIGAKIITRGDEQIKTPKTLPKPIHKEFIQKALDNCVSAEEKLLVVLLYSLGLRVSELEQMRISDIGKEWVKVAKGKGGKERMIPLLPEVAAMLDTHLKTSQNKCFIFEDKAQPLSQNRLRYKLSKIFKRVGIKATPHQLRHSFASDLINKGARIVDVSELLGHKEVTTTQIYTKLSMNRKLFSYLDAHPMCKE